MTKKVVGLFLIGLIVSSASLFAGGAKEAPEAAVAAEIGNEAPQLAALVAAGDLPPLEQRLPSEPLVVEPVDRIGEYGGTWRRAVLGGADEANMTRTVLYNMLVRWAPDWSGVIPDIAKSFTVNDDSTAFTFQLREGMRWSDGHPFTSADIRFWFEAVFSNPNLTAGCMDVAGVELLDVEVHDEYSLTFRFAGPSGLFLQTLASPGFGENVVSYARHYFEQFHAEYNPDIDEVLRAEDFGDWVDLFDHKNNRTANVEQPTLNGWVVTNPYDGTTTEVRFERNPYYWKVDTEGNQLPYLDRVVFDVLQDGEVVLLRTLDGQYDLIGRHVANAANRPVLFQSMDRGNFRFIEEVSDSSTAMALHYNFTHQDPVKREVIENKNFRVGLSHAINRDEINDLIFAGLAEPWQVAPLRTSAFFDEEFAKQFTEYDVELANEHLDRAGYTQRDSQGYRVGPDGNRISLMIELINSDEQIAVLELIQGYWREVGVHMDFRPMDRSLLWERKGNLLHDIMVWQGTGGLNPIMTPVRWIPVAGGAHHGIGWSYWYNNPDHALAEEPPAPVKRKLELYDAVRSVGDPQRQHELMTEVLEISRESFRLTGIVIPPPGYKVVRNDFHNVPEVMPGSWNYPTPGPTTPEQYFTTRGR